MTEVATLTLTEFLLARIAEDERLIVDEHQPANWCERDEGVHWDAARAHAECEAKRQIVAEHQPFHSGDYCAAHDGRYLMDDCPTLRALALPYSGHPDYRDAWRP